MCKTSRCRIEFMSLQRKIRVVNQYWTINKILTCSRKRATGAVKWGKGGRVGEEHPTNGEVIKLIGRWDAHRAPWQLLKCILQYWGNIYVWNHFTMQIRRHNFPRSDRHNFYCQIASGDPHDGGSLVSELLRFLPIDTLYILLVSPPTTTKCPPIPSLGD